MAHFIKNESASKTEFVNAYSGIDEETLKSRVNELLIQSGYKVEVENLGIVTYVKGNRVLRILLGAFYKYFKFEVSVEEGAENTKLAVKTETSGMSGGLIGMNQVKKEVKRLEVLFQLI